MTQNDAVFCEWSKLASDVDRQVAFVLAFIEACQADTDDRCSDRKPLYDVDNLRNQLVAIVNEVEVRLANSCLSDEHMIGLKTTFIDMKTKAKSHLQTLSRRSTDVSLTAKISKLDSSLQAVVLPELPFMDTGNLSYDETFNDDSIRGDSLSPNRGVQHQSCDQSLMRDESKMHKLDSATVNPDQEQNMPPKVDDMQMSVVEISPGLTVKRPKSTTSLQTKSSVDVVGRDCQAPNVLAEHDTNALPSAAHEEDSRSPKSDSRLTAPVQRAMPQTPQALRDLLESMGL